MTSRKPNGSPKGLALAEIGLLFGVLIAVLIGYVSLFGARVEDNFRQVNDRFSQYIDGDNDNPGGDNDNPVIDTGYGNASCPAGHPLGIGGSDSHLARGFNFPNWKPGYNGFQPTDAFLAELYGKGYSHVRLPVDAERLMTEYSDPIEIETFLGALDEEVHRFLDMGYAVTVDMHPDGDFGNFHENDPDAAYNRLLSAWNRIISASSNWSRQKVYFELLNEPVNHDTWWTQAQLLVTHMNSEQPGRKTIVGPGVWQRYEWLVGSNPIDGNNVFYAIHFYDPMALTHQGITWAPGDVMSRLHDVPFPADINHPDVQSLLAELRANDDDEAVEELTNAFEEPWNAERIETIFSQVSDWALANDASVIVNEFGVLDFEVGKADRTAWIRAVRQGAESNCIGWQHWDFSDGFAMVDENTGQLDPDIHKALMESDPVAE